MSLTYSTIELCSSPLSLSPNSRGGRFYNPHRSSRSLRSAPGGPEHAPWSAPMAQTLPERGEAALTAPCKHRPLCRTQRGSPGPTATPACPAILPQGQHQPFPSLLPATPQLCPTDPAQRSAPLTPRHSAGPRPPAPALPKPGNRQSPHQKGSYFLSVLQHPRARAQWETSAQRKKDLVKQD